MSERETIEVGKDYERALFDENTRLRAHAERQRLIARDAEGENERLREALAALHPDVLYLRRHLARNATEDAKLALERLAATLAAALRTDSKS